MFGKATSKLKPFSLHVFLRFKLFWRVISDAVLDPVNRSIAWGKDLKLTFDNLGDHQRFCHAFRIDIRRIQIKTSRVKIGVKDP